MKNLSKLQRAMQRGFTLIELGIAIAIAAVVIGIALMVVPQLLADNKVTNEITNLGSITARIQKAFARETTYATASLIGLINSDVFANNMVTTRIAPGGVSNQWGGAVTFVAGNATELQFQYAAVPTYECRNLLPQVEQMFSSISVAATPVKAVGGAFNSLTAATQCQTAASVAIIFGVPK